VRNPQPEVQRVLPGGFQPPIQHLRRHVGNALRQRQLDPRRAGPLRGLRVQQLGMRGEVRGERFERRHFKRRAQFPGERFDPQLRRADPGGERKPRLLLQRAAALRFHPGAGELDFRAREFLRHGIARRQPRLHERDGASRRLRQLRLELKRPLLIQRRGERGVNPPPHVAARGFEPLGARFQFQLLGQPRLRQPRAERNGLRHADDELPVARGRVRKRKLFGAQHGLGIRQRPGLVHASAGGLHQRARLGELRVMPLGQLQRGGQGEIGHGGGAGQLPAEGQQREECKEGSGFHG
jgi:hypothetical protein